MDTEQVEQYRKKYSQMSDDELYAKMHGHKELNEHHLAAKIILKDRSEKRDRVRFHLVFWPSSLAALVAVLVFIM